MFEQVKSLKHSKPQNTFSNTYAGISPTAAPLHGYRSKLKGKWGNGKKREREKQTN